MKESNSIYPYSPPRVDSVPEFPSVGDSGSLWRVVDGRLQVRHMAQLPDISIDGAPNDAPRECYAQAMTRLPVYLNGVLWLPVGIAVSLRWLRLDGVILFLVCVWFALLFVKVKEPHVFFYRRILTSADRWRSWLRSFCCLSVVMYANSLAWKKGGLESFGWFNSILLTFGTIAALQLAVDRGFGHVRKRTDGWFELKGIRPAVIARLEEIQQRQPPHMEESPAMDR